MKKLQELTGVKTLSKKEQQAVKGGKFNCDPGYVCPVGYCCVINDTCLPCM